MVGRATGVASSLVRTIPLVAQPLFDMQGAMRFGKFKTLFGAAPPKDAATPVQGADGRSGTQRDPHSIQRFRKILKAHDIATVIDVGANQGQFALYVRHDLQFAGRIISVEPLPEAFAKLQGLARPDPNWSALNLALGDAEAVLPINIAGNLQSSSILPMLQRHVSVSPRSAYVGKVDVAVRRLDSLPDLCSAAADRCMLKVDTQGYEAQVLRGAGSCLDQVLLIYLELSLVPLYEGEPLIEDVIAYLRQRRFAPIAIFRSFSDGKSGHQLQGDVLFSKSG